MCHSQAINLLNNKKTRTKNYIFDYSDLFVILTMGVWSSVTKLLEGRERLVTKQVSVRETGTDSTDNQCFI